MSHTGHPPSTRDGDFPEIFQLLVQLGLAKRHSQTISDSVYSVLGVRQIKSLRGPLTTPFPSTPPQTGALFLPENPQPIEQAAEQNLQHILTPLLLNPLSHSELLCNRPLINAIKTFNLLRLVCTTALLRALIKPLGGKNPQNPQGPQSSTATVQPRAGFLPFLAFLKNNPDIVSVTSESCEQAYALQHLLDPGIVFALRAGLVTTQVLFSRDGLRRVRDFDESILAFTDQDELIRQLKNAKTACVISYRHVKHDDNITGLCQQQLDSVAAHVASYDYVWLDTVYSRASRQRWAPACVTLFGILDCFKTSQALEQPNRTWIKAESIMSSAKQQFLSTRPRDYVYTSMVSDIQLHAAKKIADGALEGTESLFATDKEKLEQWASNAYTCPRVGLSGTLGLQDSNLSSVAAQDHFDWSVLKSPWWPKSVMGSERLVSPEQSVLYSIDVKALRCNQLDFVLRLVMRIQDRGHCFFDEDDRRVYVLFGCVGCLGSRLFVYDDVSVVSKGQWMQLIDARKMREFCLAAEDIILVSTAMAMNSANRFELRYLDPEPGRPDDAILNDTFEGTYEYVARFNNVNGLAERSHSPYPFSKCMDTVKILVGRIATGLQYHKLATVYFGFCEAVSWDGVVRVNKAQGDVQRASGNPYGVEIT